MLNADQQFGRKSESAALSHLQEKGYEIIGQNYRTRGGEIDIIAKDGEVIVFIEVKARRSERYGSPKWGITPAKQRKLSMAALYYLKEKRLMNSRARFDVVSIQQGKIEIIKNAFDLAYG